MATTRTTPASIDDYIARFPPDVRAVLGRIRRAIGRAAPAACETISYQMPAFRQRGILVYFAAWKDYVGLYPPVTGDARLEKAVAPFAGPKGNLRFSLDAPIPYRLIERIVKHRVMQQERKSPMAERKTQATRASVKAFLDSVKNERRRKDGLVLARMMARVSGKRATMWGPSIVGFGTHRYRYANGGEGEICRIGFSPRAAALVLYLASFPDRARYLAKLGPHTTRGGCIYVTKLDEVDHEVLEEMIRAAFEHGAAEAADTRKGGR